MALTEPTHIVAEDAATTPQNEMMPACIFAGPALPALMPARLSFIAAMAPVSDPGVTGTAPASAVEKYVDQALAKLLIAVTSESVGVMPCRPVDSVAGSSAISILVWNLDLGRVDGGIPAWCGP